VSLVHASVEVDAPPDRVWKVVSDPRNLPRWDRHIISVTGAPDRSLRQGDEYVTDLRFMGVRGKSRVRVLEIRDGEYAKIRLSGLLSAVVETRLEPIGNDRTRLDQRIEYRFAGGPLGRIAAGAVQRLGASAVLRRGVLAQKRQIERGS
jgi:uncharacterized membrane protein